MGAWIGPGRGRAVGAVAVVDGRSQTRSAWALDHRLTPRCGAPGGNRCHQRAIFPKERPKEGCGDVGGVGTYKRQRSKRQVGRARCHGESVKPRSVDTGWGQMRPHASFATRQFVARTRSHFEHITRSIDHTFTRLNHRLTLAGAQLTGNAESLRIRVGRYRQEKRGTSRVAARCWF